MDMVGIKISSDIILLILYFWVYGRCLDFLLALWLLQDLEINERVYVALSLSLISILIN